MVFLLKIFQINLKKGLEDEKRKYYNKVKALASKSFKALNFKLGDVLS